MKKTLIAAILALSAASVAQLHAQGLIQWGNAFGGLASTAAIRAPIYGVDPANPTLAQSGNTSTGRPAGTTQYGGALLAGTGFTVALYAGATPTAVMANNTATDVSVFQAGASAGFMVGPRIAIIQGIGPSVPANVQFRAWDNRGGTVTSWAAVMADPNIAHGQSGVFATGGLGGPDPAGGPDISPPTTSGIRSFNLVGVPEPSLIALGALALGGLLLRRRK